MIMQRDWLLITHVWLSIWLNNLIQSSWIVEKFEKWNLSYTLFRCPVIKLWRILWPGIANCLKFAASSSYRACTYDKFLWSICFGPYILGKYVYACVKIWLFRLTWFRLEIVIHLNTIYGYHYWALPQLKFQRFERRLEVEPRVGTPIRRNLDHLNT